MRDKRLKRLEESVKSNSLLREVTPLDYFYEDTKHLESSQPYFTDEPIKSIDSFYDDDEYKRVSK